MKVRVFGAEACPRCSDVKRRLGEARVNFEFVDAYDFDDPVADALCEANAVDEIPHVQLLDDAGDVLAQWTGEIDLAELLHRIAAPPGHGGPPQHHEVRPDGLRA